MEENLYSAPKAEVSVENETEKNQTLASRWARLGAAILDGIIYGMCMGIGMGIAMFMLKTQITEGGADDPEALMALIFKMYGIAFLVAIPVMIINAKMIMSSGQTIGKKACSIKTVKLSGENAPLGTVFGLRWLVPFIITLVPLVGSIFALVNVLFIFGEEKKCIHDLMASTKVVNA